MTYTYIPGAAPAGQNGRATVRQSNIELLRIVAMMLLCLLSMPISLRSGRLMPLRSRRSGRIGPARVATGLCSCLRRCLCHDFRLFRNTSECARSAEFRFPDNFLAHSCRYCRCCRRIRFVWCRIKKSDTFAGDWFSPCYMLLMLVSPALNTFVEKLDRRAMGRYLLIFFGLQTVFGWIPARYMTAVLP